MGADILRLLFVAQGSRKKKVKESETTAPHLPAKQRIDAPSCLLITVDGKQTEKISKNSKPKKRV